MEKHRPEAFALITGAGRGLGRAFATALAKKGINVLLTALPGEGLDAFCTGLKAQYCIRAEYFECNLTREEDLSRLVRWVKENFTLNILINNAGIGGTSEFEKVHADFLNDMILLNVRATVMLTHQLLPLLRRSKAAWILNVSSMASFSPIGYKTAYPASKAFVLHFSRGLYEELRGSGIFVSVVHPGPMKTNSDVAMRIEKQGRLARLSLVAPEVIAEKSIRQLFKKDSLILIGWMNKINWLLMKTIPIWIRLPLITQIVKREISLSPVKTINHESIGYGSQQLAGGQCDR
ncbi:SDR family NAD(P)-dependent oxidoreductase [Compostibacter hankyongensis]|uniref:SDR family oxidoreductase n=1 Tax=Compostibacter hankyongensis TaxID=1007089 RepID=A0ABP8G599_9BACT